MDAIFTMDFNRDVFTQNEAEEFAGKVNGKIKPCYYTKTCRVFPTSMDGEFIGFVVTIDDGEVYPEY